MATPNDSTVFDEAWWDELYRESELSHEQAKATMLAKHVDLAALGMKGIARRVTVDMSTCVPGGYASRWYITTDVETGWLTYENGEYSYSAIETGE